MNLNERLNSFFKGRYGNDNMNRFLLIVVVVFTFLYAISKWLIFDIATTLLIVYIIFRMMSRNHSKRTAENKKYLELSEPVRIIINNLRPASKVPNKVFSCPKCKQKLRVPKGKGKIEITCPKCRNNFVKRS